MSTTYFAEIDSDGLVLRVLAADADFVASLGGTWVETWTDGGERKNYAGEGYTFDAQRNAFIPPKPRPDATLDEETALWSPDTSPSP